MPDALAIVGLGAISAGVYIAAGIAPTLIVAGSIMLITGMLAAWKRSR